MQLIEELPFGLAICAANGETATLTGLSDRQMRLRTHGAEPLSSLAVRFLTDDRASYVACPVDGWRVSHEERTRLGVLRMVDVPCPAFAKEARRALKLYTEYLRLKSLGDDEYLAHALTGCPYVDTTARSFAEQKAAWLRGAAAFSLPGDWTLALTADSFAAYRRFLSLPLDAFQREATLNLPAFARPAGRIYIGNAGCPRLFPDRPLLSKLLARAKEQGLNVTIVLPPVSENAVPETESLLAYLDTTNADELCVNDLGALALARKTHLTPTLGIQLNRRRKDARLPYKTGCRGARTSETPCSSDPSDNVSATLSGVQPVSREPSWRGAPASETPRSSEPSDNVSATLPSIQPDSCEPSWRGSFTSKTLCSSEPSDSASATVSSVQPISCGTGWRGAPASETPRASEPSDNVAATLSGVQPISCETGWRGALASKTPRASEPSDNVAATFPSIQPDSRKPSWRGSFTSKTPCSSEPSDNASAMVSCVRTDSRPSCETGWRGALASETTRLPETSGSMSATLSGVQPVSCETGWQNALPLLSRNGLDDADFREWLAELGVTRFEYEACGYAPSIAPGRHSLHLPFYQTNTSHACPLAAACFGLDPGQDVPDCRHICETRARLYPDELHMVGRYNSLFALDPNILASPARLSRLLASGIDRLVVSLLSL